MRPKRLLILSSFGGYGHIVASNTLKQLLSDTYEIDIIYPIKELRIWNIPSGEAIYNFLLSRSWNWLTNWVAKVPTPRLFLARQDKVRQIIEAHIQKKQPSLLISLIPFVNYPASEAARAFDLPFLIVTTDTDLHNWVLGMDKRLHDRLKVTIGSDLPTTRNRLIHHKIPPESIETIGLPLRLDFISIRQTREELRQKYHVSKDAKVVLVVMGGLGGRSIYRYVQEIANSCLKVHLIVCTGKNRRLAKKLGKVIPKLGTTIDIVPFTEKVHELFALADLILTKPGPGTINEAIALELPILVDRMRVPLFWEQANIDMVKKLQIGADIPSLSQIIPLVELFLYDEKTIERVKSAYCQLPKNKFDARIKPLIQEMCPEILSGEVKSAARMVQQGDLLQ